LAGADVKGPVRVRNLVLVPIIVLAACGSDEISVSRGPSTTDVARYSATATVLEAPGHGPQLCLGGVAESYPPQCGGPDVVGWDWNAVDQEESANGTTWGTYRVVGTWDGRRLSQTEPAGPPEGGDRSSDDFATPCDPPPGGWAVVDPATTTDEAQESALSHARDQPDFGGAWVDQREDLGPGSGGVDDGTANDPTRLVLNLRFTADLRRHEIEARRVWGGALCISQARVPLTELLTVQAGLHEELEALTSSVDEVRGVVAITVIVADGDLQRTLDARYGANTVEVSSALRRLP